MGYQQKNTTISWSTKDRGLDFPGFLQLMQPLGWRVEVAAVATGRDFDGEPFAKKTRILFAWL